MEHLKLIESKNLKLRWWKLRDFVLCKVLSKHIPTSQFIENQFKLLLDGETRRTAFEEYYWATRPYCKRCGKPL